MTASSLAGAGTYRIAQVKALEILDSRGRPTLQVSVSLENGSTGKAGVPSGASTGTREAVERRDGDKTRYGGLGVLGAVGAVRGEVAALLGSQDWHDLAEIDIERYAQISERFPVWLIEDALAEDDWDGWVALTRRLGERLQLVGDDIFVTNPAIISDAISRGVANAALIKVNQIGTVTETLKATAVCRRGGYAQLVSHRSGETSDSFIADLAVSTGCGELKAGAPARGERVAKYNRLTEIAAASPGLRYGLPPR